MLTITYGLQARHFLLQQGKVVKKVREPSSLRTVELSSDGEKVTASSEDGRETFIPHYPVTLESDPVDIEKEDSPLDETRILDAVSPYRMNALLSLYTEKRTVRDEFLKRQTFYFFTLRIQDGTDYLYADRNVRNVEKILMMHSLPRKKVEISSLPVILSKNVVGHIFHEYVHSLEMDILGVNGQSVVGNSFTEGLPGLTVCEDPALQTVGHAAFTDEGKIAQKTLLIEKNIIVGFLDSILYPHNQGLCGYLGYGRSFFPLPRSTNLCITGEYEKYDTNEYLEVVELNMDLHSLDPFGMEISFTEGEGLYIREGVPLCRVAFSLEWKGTIQEFLSEVFFVTNEPVLPSVGGICVKNGILFRSAQTAPAALWEKPVEMRATP